MNFFTLRFLLIDRSGWLPVPAPDSVIACGLPEALSVILTLAVFAPMLVGVKLTPKEQVPPIAILSATASISRSK